MSETYHLATSIVAKLVRSGFIAYFAGGWVRDFILGHPSEDIDIATNASPSQIMDLFPQTILVGLAFGVVIIVIEGHQFEVATFRKDLEYIDGRHPSAIEMSSPSEDAQRRDFTINGMFYDPLEERIHDFVNGQEDIKKRVIRTIGNPHDRFFEDRLRMLRAFRFAARFEFAIEQETQEAIKENADQLFPSVAMERVWQEFEKMALYPRFEQSIVEMQRLSVLSVIFPELTGFHLNDIRQRVHPFRYFPKNCPTILYLMELFIHVPLTSKIEIAKRLKVPNRDIKWIEYTEAINEAVASEKKENLRDLYQWANLMANPDWEIAIQLLAARYESERHSTLYSYYQDRYKGLETHIERIRKGKPIVNAEILQKKGIPNGKKMGLLLKEAQRISIVENLHDPEIILSKLSLDCL